MAIFNEACISELFHFKKKKPNTSSKYTISTTNNTDAKYTRVDLTASDKQKFEKLYNNEVLTAEGMKVPDGDNSLDPINKWFRNENNCNSSNINIYVTTGKVMNAFYHLTGDNCYPNDFHIVLIDWISSGVRNPYKGQWRWFSDVVDNNAKREIMKKNPFHKHYNSIYYGPIGWED